MILELHSMKDDILILDFETVRPNLYIGGLEVNEDWDPWHGTWRPLHVTKFNEDFEIVKEKITTFYKMEGQRNPQTGCTVRSSGWASLNLDNRECWTLQNAKILNCKIMDVDKSISLELLFDGVNYKNFQVDSTLQKDNS